MTIISFVGFGGTRKRTAAGQARLGRNLLLVLFILFQQQVTFEL